MGELSRIQIILHVLLPRIGIAGVFDKAEHGLLASQVFFDKAEHGLLASHVFGGERRTWIIGLPCVWGRRQNMDYWPRRCVGVKAEHGLLASQVFGGESRT